MTSPTTGQSAARRAAPAGVVFALLGLALFAYFVWKAGAGEIWAQMRALGAGFLVILLISAARPVVRSLAWVRCFEPEHSLSFRDALHAYLVGDALGNLMPFGIVVSEPAKAAFARERVPLAAAVSALAVENLFYMLSVALFVFAGAAAMLLSFPLPPKLRLAAVATLCVVAVVIGLAVLVVRRRWKFLTGALRLVAGARVGRRFVEGRGERVAAVEDRVYGFYARHRGRFLPILLLEGGFHLAGVAEVFATLYLMLGRAPAPAELALASFVLESVNRVINVVFKFVPMRVGVDEAGSSIITRRVLNLGETAGVTLAIVRKARIIVWTGVGVALLVRRGLTVRGAAEQARRAARDAADERRRAESERVAVAEEPLAARRP
jgi:hypothetical protein